MTNFFQNIILRKVKNNELRRIYIKFLYKIQNVFESEILHKKYIRKYVPEK